MLYKIVNKTNLHIIIIIIIAFLWYLYEQVTPRDQLQSPFLGILSLAYLSGYEYHVLCVGSLFAGKSMDKP